MIKCRVTHIPPHYLKLISKYTKLINKIINKLKKVLNIITGAGEYLFVSSHSIESSKSIAIGLLYGFSLSLIGLIECSDGRLND